MNVEWAWKGKDSGNERQVRNYLEAKLPRLERLLKHYPEDQRLLTATVYYLPNHVEPWEARLVLQLPTGTLVADQESESSSASIDIAFDDLVREVRKHKDRVRKDYLHRRKRQRAAVAEVVPFVSPETIAERRDAFFKLLQPFLAPVREHATQEIDILEIEEDLPRGEVTADDIVDEVLAQAWEQFPRRPQDRSLDVWLLDLLHRKLDDVVANRESVLMGQVDGDGTDETLIPDEDVDRNDYWMERLFGARDIETLDELIPDDHAREAWESLSDDGQRDRVRQALASLPAVMRRAFVLHEVQGYEMDEIAMMQGRGPEEITEDIEAARKQLRKLLECEA